MTTCGMKAGRGNGKKYDIMKRVLQMYTEERVIVMGGIKGHIGLLGENVNENGQLSIDFVG